MSQGKGRALHAHALTNVDITGMTYRYKGLRLFAHPFPTDQDAILQANTPVAGQQQVPGTDTCDQRTSWAAAAVGALNRHLSLHATCMSANATPQTRAAASTSDAGENAYNVVLINYFDPNDPEFHADRLMTEPYYGMGPMAVSWHCDDGVAPHSSISVYNAMGVEDDRSEAERHQGRWKVAVKVSWDIETPAVAVPMHDKEAYVMLPGFNARHQHAVMAGGTWRFSCTHRVADLPASHYDDIVQRCRRAIAALSAHSPTRAAIEAASPALCGVVLEASAVHTEVEGEWLRQYHFQRFQRRPQEAGAHFWAPRIAQLLLCWASFEWLLARWLAVLERLREAKAAEGGGLRIGVGGLAPGGAMQQEITETELWEAESRVCSDALGLLSAGDARTCLLCERDEMLGDKTADGHAWIRQLLGSLSPTLRTLPSCEQSQVLPGCEPSQVSSGTGDDQGSGTEASGGLRIEGGEGELRQIVREGLEKRLAVRERWCRWERERALLMRDASGCNGGGVRDAVNVSSDLDAPAEAVAVPHDKKACVLRAPLGRDEDGEEAGATVEIETNAGCGVAGGVEGSGLAVWRACVGERMRGPSELGARCSRTDDGAGPVADAMSLGAMGLGSQGAPGAGRVGAVRDVITGCLSPLGYSLGCLLYDM